ncbi:4-methyl-5(b-hydroxyethyl)-thiazole monophosphate biosynthesis [Ectothiorhodospira magna]|uniref:4-methyl-5(B-hydroxyethyl)-thiazole monophosphate biosynthesis n=1 Tax=Ectothiorhodospira magna TaxID=867345 RepID=A0A1H9AI68_9GAMM|nr:DJ-1 family glyoxalase III [Ectothiorhodospira magna]SEP76436.1 4-methyl-5(b-hydroxyethyl)-thiazole monophosphate biosynthesis [Ectothiorhodospira magna]
MARILIPLANGCEEVEAVTLIDLLRRADFQVVTAGLEDGPVTGAHGIVLMPDQPLEQAQHDTYDLIVLPGGLPGSDHLDNDPRIHALVNKLHGEGRYVAAICAAPKVLARAGLLAGRRATAYPTVLEGMALADTQLTGQPVEVDGTIVTSRSPGTAMEFALALIELLAGADKRKQVEDPLCRC